MKTAKDQRRQVALFSAYFVSPVEARAPQLAKTYLQQICLSGLGVDVVASAQHRQKRAPPPSPIVNRPISSDFQGRRLKSMLASF
jgi:hypothetical protein